MLTVLVKVQDLILRYFCWKNVSSFCIHIFFSKNISLYAISNDQSFNDTLTSDIVIFEQLGPDCDVWSGSTLFANFSYKIMSLY